jgi:hypothetical protein
MKRHLPTKESFQFACENGEIECVKRWKELDMIHSSLYDIGLVSSAEYGHVDLIKLFLSVESPHPTTRIESAIEKLMLHSPRRETHDEVLWVLLLKLSVKSSYTNSYFFGVIKKLATLSTFHEDISRLLGFVTEVNRLIDNWINQIYINPYGWPSHLLEIYSVRYPNAFNLSSSYKVTLHHQHTLVLFVRERLLPKDLLKLLCTYITVITE